MAHELKEGQGSLFTNDKREKKTHPHLRGTIRVDGTDYWLSAWINETKDSQLTPADKQNLMQILGFVRFGLSVQPKEERRRDETREDGFYENPPDDDRDLPF